MSQEQLQKAFEFSFQATVSQEYFRVLEWRWHLAYVIANVALALFTAIGLYASRKPKLLGELSNKIAAISIFLALVAFIIPSGRWAQEYRDFAQDWTALRIKSESLESQIKANDIEPQKAAFELTALGNHITALVGREPATWQGLLVEVWGNEAERVYGVGVRTPEQVDARLKEMGVEPIKPPPMLPPGHNQQVAR